MVPVEEDEGLLAGYDEEGVDELGDLREDEELDPEAAGSVSEGDLGVGAEVLWGGGVRLVCLCVYVSIFILTSSRLMVRRLLSKWGTVLAIPMKEKVERSKFQNARGLRRSNASRFFMYFCPK